VAAAYPTKDDYKELVKKILPDMKNFVEQKIISMKKGRGVKIGNSE